MSTKIHTLVDALGNPLGFFLTPGQAHDLQGADELLPHMQADTLLADKAFDADQRVSWRELSFDAQGGLRAEQQREFRLGTA